MGQRGSFSSLPMETPQDRAEAKAKENLIFAAKLEGLKAKPGINPSQMMNALFQAGKFRIDTGIGDEDLANIVDRVLIEYPELANEFRVALARKNLPENK